MSRCSCRGLPFALAGLVLGPLGSAHGELLERHGELLPTPRDVEGSFYPRDFPVDVDNDLLRIVPPRSNPADGSGPAAHGEPGPIPLAAGRAVYLSGRVLDTGGGPIPAARVEIRQCDARGRYADQRAPGQPDRHFAGYGITTTDWGGNYHFRTIRPVSCEGRTPHIRMRVTAPGHAPLITRIYDAAEAERNAADAIFLQHSAEARRQLTIEFEPLKTGPAAPMSATLDVVLALE